jgi:hypothetical protein
LFKDWLRPDPAPHKDNARATHSFPFEFRREIEANARERARPGAHWLSERKHWEAPMGRYLLLWLLGIPLPILLLIWVFGGLH